MTDDHEEANYMRVFYWLAALTVIEIGVIYLPLAKLTIGIMLVGMALAKASLVGLYFMHLRYEKRTLGMVALTPLLICTLLIFALIPDLTATPHQSSTQTTEEHSGSASQ